MLALSVPLRSAKDEREVEMEGFDGEFPDFCAGSLLDSIDFDDLFVGISDGDVLPDLENLAEFTLSGGDESDANASTLSVEENSSFKHEKVASPETVVMSEDVAVKEADEGVRKSMAHSKNPSGKRKVKVDWTPELHRRFVQAVEQLGVDKAVPSRILDLMGIDCLTRHNIASHLQKYRSHRKHLLAREAEAASWSQRRQMYGAAGGGRITGKRDHHHHHHHHHNNVKPWIAPTMGFPPVTPMPPHFRPLHVWGHPSVDQSMINMWPKHLTPSPPPPPPQAWPSRHSSHPLPPPVPVDNSFWISHPSHIQTPATPCFPPHLPPSKFPALPIPGIPPPPMYKVEQGGLGMPTVAAPGQTLSPQPPSDVHPSKESVDAAIGDVLSKPWLPLPLGLKPPSLTGVMVELQHQGISKIPPNCA